MAAWTNWALAAELELASEPGRSDEQLRAAVQRAGRETARLIRLNENLLALARADETPTSARPVPVRLDVVATRAVDAAGAFARRAQIDVLLATEPTTVIGDEDQLRQIVDNLLGNAIRWTPPGGTVTVSTSSSTTGPAAELEADLEADLEAELEVGDTGPGIPETFLPRAFERFSRAETPSPAASHGSGLGLAVVASLVHGHGGTVTAFNSPGGGAHVRVTLPLRPRMRQHEPALP